MDKPTGGETEYDLLNTLVTPDDEQTVGLLTADYANRNPWGLCRCRMAAIINMVSRRHGWQSDQERRVLTVARYPFIAKRQGMASSRRNDLPLPGTKTPLGSEIANRGAS